LALQAGTDKTAKARPQVIQHRSPEDLLNGAFRSWLGWRQTGTRETHEGTMLGGDGGRGRGGPRDSQDGAGDEGEGQPHPVFPFGHSLSPPVLSLTRRRTQRRSKIPWAKRKRSNVISGLGRTDLCWALPQRRGGAFSRLISDLIFLGEYFGFDLKKLISDYLFIHGFFPLPLEQAACPQVSFCNLAG
jgi:hypothetical protein